MSKTTDVYNKLYMIYLCDRFGVDIGKNVIIDFSNKDVISSDFNDLKSLIEYLVGAGKVTKINENKFNLKFLENKFIANSIKGRSIYSFSFEELHFFVKEMLLKKCCDYVEYNFDQIDLNFNSGKTTREILSNGLNYYSCGELFSIIYKNIKYAYAKCQESEKKFEITTYAIRCIGYYINKSLETEWKVDSFNKPKHVIYTDIENYLFKNILNVEPFDMRLGDIKKVILNKLIYKYCCFGNISYDKWIEFSKEVNGKVSKYKVKDNVGTYVICETKSKISTSILKKYNIKASII